MNPVLNQSLFTLTNQVSGLVFKSKNEWLDRALRILLPEDCYSAAKAGVYSFAQNWLRDNKIELREHPSRTELVMDEDILGEFTVDWSAPSVRIFIKGLGAK